MEAIGICLQYEEENWGETSKSYDDSETTTNMLAYILGEQWLADGGAEFIADAIHYSGHPTGWGDEEILRREMHDNGGHTHD